MQMYPSEFLEFASVFEEVWDYLIGETLYDSELGCGTILEMDKNHEYLGTRFSKTHQALGACRA